MEIIELMKQRHAVRSYLPTPIEKEKRQILNNYAAQLNAESGLSIQIVYDEEEAFSGFMAHYGKFEGVRNYIALVGPKKDDEKVGYYGERLVLRAQEIGLNTCWVAMSYSKGKAKVNAKKSEKLHLVISLGYGSSQGIAHKSKTPNDVSKNLEEAPEWFKSGVEAALLAPTALNQQKFTFAYENGKVSSKPGVGFYTKIDLGIAKCHFELGSKKTSEIWK